MVSREDLNNTITLIFNFITYFDERAGCSDKILQKCHSSVPPSSSGRALIGRALDQSEASIPAGQQISNQCVCVIQIHTARILMIQFHRSDHLGKGGFWFLVQMVEVQSASRFDAMVKLLDSF